MYPWQLTDEGDRYKIKADRNQDHSCLSYYDLNIRDWRFKDLQIISKRCTVTNTCDNNHYSLYTIRGTKYSIDLESTHSTNETKYFTQPQKSKRRHIKESAKLQTNFILGHKKQVRQFQRSTDHYWNWKVQFINVNDNPRQFSKPIPD